MTPEVPPRGLSEQEAEELWRFTRYAYISQTSYRGLSRLLNDLSAWAEKTGRAAVTVAHE
jgi:hypothetical protein